MMQRRFQLWRRLPVCNGPAGQWLGLRKIGNVYAAGCKVCEADQREVIRDTPWGTFSIKRMSQFQLCKVKNMLNPGCIGWQC